MTLKTSSTPQLNAALKLAILQRGTQRQLCRDAAISEVRLSEIIRGRTIATKDERRALSKALGLPQRHLFPVRVTAEVRPQ